MTYLLAGGDRLAARPDLERAMWHMHNGWPLFMHRDPLGDLLFGRLPFERSGVVVVPFACNPVHVSVEQDHAVYVEPNVSVHHDLRGSG